MIFPSFGIIQQQFPAAVEPAPDRWVREELQRTGLLDPVCSGQRVIVTAGSRGIFDKPAVLAALCSAIRERGAQAVLFPAMGSHGGGTGPAQVEVLRHLGVTETSVGAPIVSEAHCEQIGTTVHGAQVFADRAVIAADHVILVNRVKEHTEYIGATESGLLKIAVVGLGRQPGAESMHRLAVSISYYQAIHAFAEVLFEKVNILGGVALLEDHTSRLRRVEAIPAAKIFDREPELLAESRNFKAKLPFDELDVLIIDEIGKEISGTGADTKVVGRIMNIYEEECSKPRITRILIRDLTSATNGNGIGIGLADYTTQRAVAKINLELTAINCITGGTPEKGRIPITLPDDRAALREACRSIGNWRPETVRMLWISNTLNLGFVAASEALVRTVASSDGMQVKSELFPLPFDGDGHLTGLVSVLAEHGFRMQTFTGG